MYELSLVFAFFFFGGGGWGLLELVCKHFVRAMYGVCVSSSSFVIVFADFVIFIINVTISHIKLSVKFNAIM